jgi:hypothetical protein
LQQLRQQQDAASAAAAAKNAETANQQAATQAATQHLDHALSLGMVGRLDEASAEVGEAKKDYPGHSKIPEFERWISQLRQQQDAAKTAAAAKNAETANQQSANQAAAKAAAQKAADQNAAADRAAEARAREAAARAAAEEKKRQGLLELSGTKWEGSASFTAEGETVSWPFRISIDGANITGEMTFLFPGEEGSQKVDLHGWYNSANKVFTMTVFAAEEGVNAELTLGGAATSATLAEGTLTIKMKMQGLPDSAMNGTWRMSRK